MIDKHQWRIVANNEQGMEVWLYVTEQEHHARQELETIGDIAPFSQYTNFRLLRREVGEWEAVS